MRFGVNGTAPAYGSNTAVLSHVLIPNLDLRTLFGRMSRNQRSQNGKHRETNLVTSQKPCVAFHTAVPDGPGKSPVRRSFTKGRCSVPAVQREDWTMRAKCRGMQDALFPEASDQKRARLVCSGCPVRFECLAEALDNRIEWGVWGGMTERERRLLLRQRSDVTSWRSILVGKSNPQAAQPAASGSQSLSDRSAPTRRSVAKSVTSVGKD
jgi:WhiB family transcriptional regulator, redox-sensing transcriptional regulator